MATVFDKILDTTTGPKSYDWYRNKVSTMTTPGARSLINKGKATLRPKYGIMNLFGYDPKFKETLPLYDRFPLIFKVKNSAGGFEGLNLHYLPHVLRARLMDALYTTATNKRYDASTKLGISCLLYTSPSPRDKSSSRMPSSA